MEKFGFVYLWRDKKNSRYYIGSHWGTEDDGYVCSSNWMRDAYARRPLDFKRRILSRIYTNRVDTFLEEERYLKMIKKEELRIRYYNISNSVKDHWVQYPEKRLSIKEKISKIVTQHYIDHPEAAQAVGQRTLGRKDSEETRQLKSEKLKGNSHTLGKHHTKKRDFIPHSEERKEKARLRMIGNKHNNPDKSRENLIKAREAHIASARSIPEDFIEQCNLLGSNRKLSVHYDFCMSGIKKWRQQAGIPEFKQLPPAMKEIPSDFSEMYGTLKTELKLKAHYKCGSDTLRRWKQQFNK